MDLDPDLLSDPTKLKEWRQMEVGWEESLLDTLPALDIDLEEYIYPLKLPSKHEVTLKIIRPKAHIRAQKPAPLIYLMHGGGFIAGSVHQLTRPGREFAKEFNAVVVLGTYRLAPEAPFPAQFEDCWETVRWLADHAAKEFDARPNHGFIVGGASAGGTLAAVISQQAQERGLPVPITGSFITIPMLLTEEIVPEQYRSQWTAREENVPFPSVNKASLQAWRDLVKLNVTSPLFSPFNSPVSSLKTLPRTYIQVGGLDPLRDDGVLYERLLRENGVETRLDNYPELEHMTYSIMSNEDHPAELGPKTLAAMGWLLRRE